MPQYSIHELKELFPTIPVIETNQLVIHAYLTEEQWLAWHKTENFTQDQIPTPDENFINALLNKGAITVIITVFHSVTPPIADHYAFWMRSRVDGEYPEAYGLLAYVPKLEMARLYAIQRFAAGDASMNTLLTLVKIPNIQELLFSCYGNNTVYDKFLKAKELFYLRHTRGFVSTMAKTYNGLQMFHQLYKCLTLKDLCNLRATCRGDTIVHIQQPAKRQKLDQT